MNNELLGSGFFLTGGTPKEDEGGPRGTKGAAAALSLEGAPNVVDGVVVNVAGVPNPPLAGAPNPLPKVAPPEVPWVDPNAFGTLAFAPNVEPPKLDAPNEAEGVAVLKARAPVIAPKPEPLDEGKVEDAPPEDEGCPNGVPLKAEP